MYVLAGRSGLFQVGENDFSLCIRDTHTGGQADVYKFRCSDRQTQKWREAEAKVEKEVEV